MNRKIGNYRSANYSSSEVELSKKLVRIVLAIVAITIFCVLSLFVFAPLFGSAFGLLSKNRNSEEGIVTVKIQPPTLSNLPASTNKSSLDISGFAGEGDTIKLYVNGPEVAQTTTGSDGIFNFSAIQLNKGRNTLFAKAINIKNEESEQSVVHTIILDTENPKIEITSPKDGETVKNLNKRITITGTINEKASIRVNDRMVIQKSDLSFEYSLGVKAGSVEIKVSATDEAGNKNEETIKVNYREES